MSPSLEGAVFQVDLLRRIFGRAAAPLVGRYEVHERAAQGGGGKVFRGYDPELDRPVAIKTPLADPTTVQRLRRESRTLACFRHPAVLEVYDVVDSAWGPAIILPWVECGTLTAWQAERNRRALEVFEAYLAVGRGLCAMHRHGLIHRDFKPDNVLMMEDGPRLCDFGLARAPDPHEFLEASTRGGDSGEITEAGAAPGTPAYMPPEQRLGHATAHADQYAWGVALTKALRSLDDRVGGARLLQRLEPPLLRATAPAIGDRYSSLDVLLDTLERRARRGSRRLAWIALTVVFVGLCGIAFSFARSGRAPTGIAVPEAAATTGLDSIVARARADYDSARIGQIPLVTATRSLEQAYFASGAAQQPHTAALIASELVTIERLRTEYDSAMRWSSAGLALTERAGLGRSSASAALLTATARLSVDLRRPLEARRLSARALAIVRALDDPDPMEHARALLAAAFAAMALGDVEHAQGHLLAIRERLDGRDAHLPAYVASLVLSSRCAEVLGQREEQAWAAEAALETCPVERASCAPFRVHALLSLAKLVPVEDWATFDALTTEALGLAEAQRDGSLDLWPNVARVRAERLVDRGQPGVGERELTRAIDTAAGSAPAHMASLLHLRALLRLQQGRYDDAERDANRFASLGNQFDRVAARTVVDRIARLRDLSRQESVGG